MPSFLDYYGEYAPEYYGDEVPRELDEDAATVIDPDSEPASFASRFL